MSNFNHLTEEDIELLTDIAILIAIIICLTSGASLYWYLLIYKYRKERLSLIYKIAEERYKNRALETFLQKIMIPRLNIPDTTKRDLESVTKTILTKFPNIYDKLKITYTKKGVFSLFYFKPSIQKDIDGLTKVLINDIDKDHKISEIVQYTLETDHKLKYCQNKYSELMEAHYRLNEERIEEAYGLQLKAYEIALQKLSWEIKKRDKLIKKYEEVILSNKVDIEENTFSKPADLIEFFFDLAFQ
jgi:hypothetical protein